MMRCPSKAAIKVACRVDKLRAAGDASCPRFPVDFAFARACRQEFQFANNKFEKPLAARVEQNGKHHGKSLATNEGEVQALFIKE